MLEQVRTTVGDARIVEAAKVRSGGIGGFFAKERFRVVVEPGAEPARRARRGAPTVRVPEGGSNALALLDMADAVSAAEREQAVVAAGPARPGRRRSFDQVLAAAETAPPRTAGGGAEPPAPPAPGELATVPPARAARPNLRPPARRDLGRPAGRSATRPVDAIGAAVVDLTERRDDRAGPPAGAAVAERAPTVLEVLEPLRSLPAAPALDPHSAGVIAVVGHGDDLGAVAARLAAEAGADAVVIASPERPEGVSVWLWLRTARDAAARRARWMQRPNPVVVALDGSLATPAWIEVMLAALAPRQVHAVLDASAAPEGAAAALGALGPVDALHLVRVSGAEDPTRLTGLGVPVATIDGRVATMARWAKAVLTPGH